MRRDLWSPEEDEKLKQFILKHGHNTWTEVPIKAGLRRGGKSCRLRWINYLRPGLRRCKFSNTEIKTVMDLHNIYGNRWSKIASCMEGRTDNDVKNIWNSEIRRHHQTKLKSNKNHVQPLSNKSPVNSISFKNKNNYYTTQVTIDQERQDLVTNYQVLNILPRSFPFSLDPMPIDIVDSSGIDAQHELCLLENPINNLIIPGRNLISIHNVEVNENIHKDSTPKMVVDEESSMTSLDKLPIKMPNCSCDSWSLISPNKDQAQADKNLNHLTYPWSWDNSEGQINDFTGQNGILMKDNMASNDDGSSSITTSQYQLLPLSPKLNPIYLDSPIIYPQHVNGIFHHHDIEDVYLIDVE